MAPFFGASTIVWANTIGVVLVSLSIGYWLGGRLGDRYPRLRELCLVVAAAAALLAVVPFAARPFFEVSTDALDEISAGAFVGSLVGVLFLIARPGRPARDLLALGDPAGGPRRRALGPHRRPPLRGLDGRLAAGDDAGGAGADPVHRHPADLPRLRGRARPGRRGRARLALPGGPGGARLRDRGPGRDGEGDRGRGGPVRGRDRGAVHPRDRGGGRRPAAGAERGPGASTPVPAGQLPHRRRLGRLPGRCRSRAGAAARADRDPRQRRRDHRPRLRPLLPRDRGRRGRDRREADRARRALLRPRQPEPRGLPRGRPALAARTPTATTT